ncbi:hypothetical protein SOVF_102920 [Spinacia oleracea]|uniref:Cucumber peeling cupredoxin n=1 Tax=Spinacia oleracea TaxID=3562 RepID=A0A9R0IYY5_SPIOL|nr:cucumber peeling cupredoxin-like [Spinacia oleracea]KNA14885.1 hypothetical protein SOVF_102920 [Spinacia oleracea]
MAGKGSCFLMAVIVIAGLSGMCSAQSTSHIVGGTTGWAIPSSPSFYSTWANGQTFSVGDTLVFNFPTNAHTVAEVSRANFNGCNGASPIGALRTTGPANVTLTTAGTHYYICTVGTHCTNGQRLSVTVTGPSGGASPAASPTTSPSGTAPAQSPGTSADTPSGSPTVPAASTPTADSPAGSSPSANFATSTGVTMFSLVSVAAAALMF